MTVLSAIQYACSFIGVSVPAAVMASTTRELVELKAITNDVASMITRAHPWQIFRTIATVTGDASTVDFDLPSDYDWMPDDSNLWSSATKQPLVKLQSTDDYLYIVVNSLTPTPSRWIIYANQIHIRAALASAVTAKYFYQSNLCVDPASGSNTAIFATDTDVFRLDERLLKLGIIYRWKQAKGQAYSQELDDYEVLKEKLIARDKGATILHQGSARHARGSVFSYPGTVPGGS